VGTTSSWEGIYRSVPQDQRSWTETAPTISLRHIDAIPHTRADPIIDVGGGASALVDALLAAGHRDVTVLDISASALAEAQRRVGHFSSVSWLVADVLTWVPTRQYAIWHDRAVFHFLLAPADRAAYVGVAAKAVRPGGHIVVATFAAGGPARCSGFDVCRYEPEQLEREFAGPDFVMVDRGSFEHETPWGARQPFAWATLRRSKGHHEPDDDRVPE
jgi:SAM-dependent methyltransferase